MSRTVSFKVGDMEVSALTDGVGEFAPAQFPTTDASEIEDLLAKSGKSGIETNFNAFLVKGPNSITLIDAGARDLLGPKAGFLHEALAEVNVTASQVDHLVITHMHPDHHGGAISELGEPVFRNAQMTLGHTEYSYWNNELNFSGKGDHAEISYARSRKVLDAYRERLNVVADDADLGQGVWLIPLPGHTPGHSGVRVSSGAEQFVIMSDIVHAQDLQFVNPEISVVFDKDPELARNSRRTLLEQLCTDRIPCSGGHVLHPGIGYVERQGSGYIFSKK